jgi:hypothetical protein
VLWRLWERLGGLRLRRPLRAEKVYEGESLQRSIKNRHDRRQRVGLGLDVCTVGILHIHRRRGVRTRPWTAASPRGSVKKLPATSPRLGGGQSASPPDCERVNGPSLVSLRCALVCRVSLDARMPASAPAGPAALLAGAAPSRFVACPEIIGVGGRRHRHGDEHPCFRYPIFAPLWPEISPLETSLRRRTTNQGGGGPPWPLPLPLPLPAGPREQIGLGRRRNPERLCDCMDAKR